MKWPVELRGDFQQFYGLNFNDAGEEFSYEYAADLAVTLPRESRVSRAVNPANEWTVAEYMLANIEYATSWLAWSKTKEAKYNHNKPKRRLTPIETATTRKKLDDTDTGEIDKILGYE